VALCLWRRGLVLRARVRLDIVTSDPQQRELSEEVEQRKKFLKKNGHVNKRIVTG